MARLWLGQGAIDAHTALYGDQVLQGSRLHVDRVPWRVVEHGVVEDERHVPFNLLCRRVFLTLVATGAAVRVSPELAQAAGWCASQHDASLPTPNAHTPAPRHTRTPALPHSRTPAPPYTRTPALPDVGTLQHRKGGGVEGVGKEESEAREEFGGRAWEPPGGRRQWCPGP